MVQIQAEDAGDTRTLILICTDINGYECYVYGHAHINTWDEFTGVEDMGYREATTEAQMTALDIEEIIIKDVETNEEQDADQWAEAILNHIFN